MKQVYATLLFRNVFAIFLWWNLIFWPLNQVAFSDFAVTL